MVTAKEYRLENLSSKHAILMTASYTLNADMFRSNALRFVAKSLRIAVAAQPRLLDTEFGAYIK